MRRLDSLCETDSVGDSLHAVRAGPVQVMGKGHAEDPTPRGHG